MDRAFVTDFGLAKVLNRAGTGARAPTIASGRRPTCRPSRCATRRAGVASDVYSLGATLYEALTGRPPFQAENPLEVYRLDAGRRADAAPHAQPRCRRDLETICLKCLEKDPARRYGSALQLAEDLRRFRDGLPILGAAGAGLSSGSASWRTKHPTAGGADRGRLGRGG